MSLALPRRRLLRRHVAVPGDHGAWVLLLGPLVVGLVAGRRLSGGTAALVVAVLAAFFLRQPLTVLVKTYNGRRSAEERPAAWFWMAVHGGVALVALSVLVSRGATFVLALAAPATAVLAWQLWLVGRRAERRRIGTELLGCGVLALAAPAAYGVSLGRLEPRGWWLWALLWLQSASSIAHAHLRLEQRGWPEVPPARVRWHAGRGPVLCTTLGFLTVGALAMARVAPPLLPLPFAVQWAETLWATHCPSVGSRPRAIGLRQLAVSSIVTLLFAAALLLDRTGDLLPAG